MASIGWSSVVARLSSASITPLTEAGLHKPSPKGAKVCARVNQRRAGSSVTLIGFSNGHPVPGGCAVTGIATGSGGRIVGEMSDLELAR